MGTCPAATGTRITASVNELELGQNITISGLILLILPCPLLRAGQYHQMQFEFLGLRENSGNFQKVNFTLTSRF